MQGKWKGEDAAQKKEEKLVNELKDAHDKVCLELRAFIDKANRLCGAKQKVDVQLEHIVDCIGVQTSQECKKCGGSGKAGGISGKVRSFFGRKKKKCPACSGKPEGALKLVFKNPAHAMVPGKTCPNLKCPQTDCGDADKCPGPDCGRQTVRGVCCDCGKPEWHKKFTTAGCNALSDSEAAAVGLRQLKAWFGEDSCTKCNAKGVIELQISEIEQQSDDHTAQASVVVEGEN